MRIIIDTNFFIIPFQFKVDIFREFDRIITGKAELFVIDKTLNELKNLKEKHAKTALALLEQKIKNNEIKLINTDKTRTVDFLITENAQKEDLVATTDIELRRRLKGKVKNLIVLRQKSHLSLI